MRFRFTPALSDIRVIAFALCQFAALQAHAAPAAATSGSTSAAPVGATDKIDDSLETRLQACMGCHGQHGGGVDAVYFPRLAGKPAGYLYNQLVAFRNGSRKYPPMNYLLAYLPDPYLQKMADYFSAQDVPAPISARPVVSAQVLATGQNIIHAGVAAQHIPACIACHGVDLAGTRPGIPGLLGLRADYISAQLGAWRYGTRTAVAPDCMQFIASSLTETQVAAVSAWLASQSAPDPKAGQHPAAAGTRVLPLACGSQK